MSHDNDPPITLILDRFDRAWENGDSPEIGDFLPTERDVSAALRRSVLIELVIIDLERRWRSNSHALATVPGDAAPFPARPILEDYVARYPELAPIESLPVELICEEHRTRHMWGDRPGHGEYWRRFRARWVELKPALIQLDEQISMAPTVDVAPPGVPPISTQETTETAAAIVKAGMKQQLRTILTSSWFTIAKCSRAGCRR